MLFLIPVILHALKFVARLLTAADNHAQILRNLVGFVVFRFSHGTIQRGVSKFLQSNHPNDESIRR